jgi:hypothetical protein
MGTARRLLTVRNPRRVIVRVLQVVVVLVVLASACNSAPEPVAPLPTVLSTAIPTPAPPLPTATTPPETWVKNHRVTEMWSGPGGDPGAISFGPTATQFCSFMIMGPAQGGRFFVYNPYNDGRFWIDADAVGPVEPPKHSAGPKPANVNCTEIVYDGQGTAGQAANLVPTSATTPTSAPLPDAKAGDPLVLALYYPWYDYNTWDKGQTSDLPREPYASAEPSTIARQVAWAHGAGIDVLVSAWFGLKDGNPTETNFKQLLSSAQANGMRAALLLETDSNEFYPNRATMVQALRQFLDVHASHPAYLRVDGKPVILVWHPIGIYGGNGQRIEQKNAATVDAWASLIGEVDPQHRALWIAEGDFFELLRVFDGVFPYSVAWSPDPANQLASYGQAVRQRSTALAARKIWAATAMPGYDDTRIVGRPGTLKVGRQDGAYYEKTFQGAIASRPDWVVITSFNEWLEGTQIEPSATYGDRYLDLTRTLTARFKAAPRP